MSELAAPSPVVVARFCLLWWFFFPAVACLWVVLCSRSVACLAAAAAGDDNVAAAVARSAPLPSAEHLPGTCNSAVSSRIPIERFRRVSVATPLVRKAWQTDAVRGAGSRTTEGGEAGAGSSMSSAAETEAAIGGARHQRNRAQHTARGTADRRRGSTKTTGHGRHRSEHRYMHARGSGRAREFEVRIYAYAHAN